MSGLIAYAVSAFVISVALVPACRAAAIRLGYTSQPRDDRWHRNPTALLGGVAIAATTILLHGATAGWAVLPAVTGGAALMAALGLIDDLVTLRAQTKLVAEIAIASIFLFLGYRLGWSGSMTLDTILTLVWIVGLTNAFNLLDNMDGLCAGIALIACMGLTAAFVATGGVTPEVRYLALLAGALAGFLVYNVHPASIFMGDSGSLFIGLNLAVLTLGSPWSAHRTSEILSIVIGPVLILLVPILDTTLVTISRILSGRSVAQGGRDHSSHRLVAIGLSERRAVTVLWGLATVFILAMVIFAVYLARVRVYDDAAAVPQGARVTPLAVDFVYRRRVAEVVLDVCLITIAYYSAYRLRFEGEALAAYFPGFVKSLPLVVGLQMLALLAVGAYRGVWRYFSLMDGVTFTKGVAAGTAASVVAVLAAYRFVDFSRGVFVIYAALLLPMIVGSRASFRLISEFAERRRHRGSRLVVYGAGAGGVAVVRELLGHKAGGYRMLGFIDDDPEKARLQMLGYPVLGDYGSLASLITNGAVDAVVVSTRLMDVDKLAELQRLCEAHHVDLSRLHLELDQLVVAS
jgi:UDP-GlcNAc:undecaprenyl-phosphate GlcNAc-1-phosphate transferase